MKKCTLTFLISSSLIFSSCIGYSTSPVLTKSPVINAAESNYKEKSIAQNLLPKDCALLTQNDLASGKPVSTIDLDNDNSDEIVAFFKVQDKYERGFIVLKKINNNWSKIFERKIECSSISRFDSINVVNKDIKSLFVGYFIGGNSGSQYYCYTLKDGKIKESNLGLWKKLEVLNTPLQNNKGFVFAAMSRGIGNVENWDIVKLNGEDICYDENFYPSYAPKIIDYYNNLLQQSKFKNSLGALGGFTYYNLINAQVKGNTPAEALKSIDTLNKISASDNTVFEIIPQSKFKFLQAKALTKLKKYDEAKSILDNLQTQLESNLVNLSASTEKNSSYLIKNAKLDLLNIYSEKFTVCKSLNQKNNLNELRDKALSLNILQDYNKDEERGLMYNKLDANTAKEQLNILKQ